MSREKSRVGGGWRRERRRNSESRGKKGRTFFSVRPPRTVLRLTFFVSFISDEPDYNQAGSISPQKTTPGGQSHYSGRVVSVKQSAR